MNTGIVARKLDKGFGFIKQDSGEGDLFFHSNELVNIDFESLNEGDKVSYEVGSGPKGPNAVSVNKV